MEQELKASCSHTLAPLPAYSPASIIGANLSALVRDHRIMEAVEQRDQVDSTRKVAPLRPPLMPTSRHRRV